VLELFAIIGFLFLSYHGALWYWERTAPRAVTVPQLIGMTEVEATKGLSAAGLRSEVVARKADEEIPEGSILAAEPPPGREVKVGRLVRLTLSAGSRWAVVPDVREMSVERARALLRQANLTLGRETARYDDGVPVGYVLGHAPEPDQRVPRGTPVDLLISKGPTPLVEPADDVGGPGIRRTEIDYVVPPGASLQEVRIVVEDQRGKRMVYRHRHRPGERVRESVEGTGPGVTVRVYLSGLVVQEKPL
jgi:serine/threonine-protein kinase